MTSPPGTHPPAGRSAFDTACSEVSMLLRLQQRTTLDSAQEADLARALTEVVRTLPRLISRRVAGHHQDTEDIAQEALTRYIRAVQQGHVSPLGSPSGYLLTIAANVVRDRHRKAPLPLPADDYILQSQAEQATDIEQVTALLDAIASVEAIRTAIAAASDADDTLVLEVVEAWLNMAGRELAAPTVREVARALGIGKSTVANTLNRFRSYIAATEER
ncbi:RNA polymerase sigma factor [Nocardioides sp. MH1]|uniref:RNA polymerase sigma factor n=1 Tax=Nocardioides sp. MH1 TaxID=3242490 RepID=UPI0035200E90